MLDRVLDDGLQNERGYIDLRDGGIDGEGNLQPFAEPGLLYIEIAPDEIDLFPNGNCLFLAMRQHVAEHVGQPLGHLLGPGRVYDDQIRDRIQGIEKEVGIDLGAQGAQFRFYSLVPQPGLRCARSVFSRSARIVSICAATVCPRLRRKDTLRKQKPCCSGERSMAIA
jgi:hypothetical protein